MFDPSTDFETIIDGAQSVTLKRRGSTETVSVSAVQIRGDLTQQSENAGGHVAKTDRTWHVIMPEATEGPRLGDRLVGSDGRHFTVLSTDHILQGRRYRCQCRDLVLAFSLCDRIDIYAAIWDEEDPPSITGWSILAAGVAARIQPLETEVDQTTDPPSSVKTFKVILAEDWPLDHNHKLAGPDGSTYTIESYEQSQRIDLLPVATVMLQ